MYANAITSDVIKYAITNELIRYAITNDLIKYAIINDVINKKINDNFVFPNTPPQLLLDDSCLLINEQGEDEDRISNWSVMKYHRDVILESDEVSRLRDTSK